ncbi:MAG: hypothetical protein PWQ09_431 [Candidatus Cloacimonadota bacterium]|nr:hypothetical protein [Candidatus Cloacimonadota bacterium]
MLDYSNSKGKFEIPYNDFAFHFDDNIVEIFDEFGDFEGYGKLTNYIKIWAFSEGYNSSFTDSVYIDPGSGAYLEIELN